MSLEVNYNVLEAEIASVLGIATSDDEVDIVMNRGLRQFYTPEPLPGERASHRWSFLKQERSFNTIEPTVTGTCKVTHNSATVIEMSPALDSVVTNASISHISITAADGSVAKYLVNNVSSTTTLTLTSSYQETGVSAQTRSFTVHMNGTYSLPVNFAGLEGPIVFDSFFGTDPQRSDMTIEVTDITRLRDKFQYLDDRDGKPLAAAVFTTGASGTVGSGFRLQIYPIPDAVYRLRYQQINEPSSIASGEQPLGGELHGETILASCLAIAEQKIFPNSPHRYRENYINRLRASVELDRQAYTTENLGYNGDPSDHKFTDANFKRILRRPDVSVTVNGTQY
jgi:hypothetical protein|tara:strand:- start:6223 stop:7242 length:1020 start_codon:yes stop_codon:yes gene_type:complete